MLEKSDVRRVLY